MCGISKADVLRRLVALEQRREVLSGPVDELSRSLWELSEEITKASKKERAEMAEELGITEKDLLSIAKACEKEKFIY